MNDEINWIVVGNRRLDANHPEVKKSMDVFFSECPKWWEDDALCLRKMDAAFDRSTARLTELVKRFGEEVPK